MAEACRQAIALPLGCAVSLDLSGAQLACPEFVSQVQAALIASELAPGRLELDLTESVLDAADAAQWARLHELRAIGVRMALNRFGAAPTSLTLLKKFEFDRLKVDAALLQVVVDRPAPVQLLRGVVALAHALGLLTVALGVDVAVPLD